MRVAFAGNPLKKPMQKLENALLRWGAVVTRIPLGQNFVPIGEIPVIALYKHFSV